MKTNHSFLSSRFNTTLKTAFFSIFLVFLFAENLAAQCKPMIKIDGNATVVNANDEFGLSLPYWLKATQTLAVGSSVSAISVLEFNVVNSNTLEFSQVINVTSTSPVTVPNGTVWKIESVAKENNSSSYHRATFASNGTYTWTVPACAEEICIEAWGAGGGGGGYYYYYSGGSRYYPGGGGGGGAFGSQCFAVTPNTTYTITVGKGGDGGDSSPTNGIAGTESKVVDPSSATIISAGGGAGGGKGVTSAGGAGGGGGTSSASTNASGADGINGVNANQGNGGNGGAGANGGAGGSGAFSSTNATTGKFPSGGGGGGGGGSYNSAAGADGKVIISW